MHCGVLVDPPLAYFDPAKKLLVDSSQHGIGAVLLQDGRPIEYASRTLKPSERNWAQIEKEALAVLCGLERFDQYTYGRTVTIENDHKPLSSILCKPLGTAPKRLQDLMMRYNRYDVNFVFVKGTELYLADTLSRAHLNSDDNNQDKHARIMNVNMFGGIPDARLEEIQTATTKDNSLQAVMKLVMEGWPDEQSTINPLALPCFDICDSMTAANGILLKGEAVVIPQSLRPDIKKRLYSSHLGTESMLRRARGTVFWPGMASDIRKMSETCESCQEMKPKNLRA